METVSTAQDLENIGVGPTCETVNIHLCWCHVGALQMCDLCLVTFWANRAFTADHQRESARWCVQHTERNCRSRRRSTARVRHGQNHAHEALVPAGPVFAREATQTAPHTSPGSLCIFGFSFHKLSLEASLDNACGSCKTGESTWRTQHCRTAPQPWS